MLWTRTCRSHSPLQRANRDVNFFGSHTVPRHKYEREECTEESKHDLLNGSHSRGIVVSFAHPRHCSHGFGFDVTFSDVFRGDCTMQPYAQHPSGTYNLFPYTSAPAPLRYHPEVVKSVSEGET